MRARKSHLRRFEVIEQGSCVVRRTCTAIHEVLTPLEQVYIRYSVRFEKCAFVRTWHAACYDTHFRAEKAS